MQAAPRQASALQQASQVNKGDIDRVEATLRQQRQQLEELQGQT